MYKHFSSWSEDTLKTLVANAIPCTSSSKRDIHFNQTATRWHDCRLMKHEKHLKFLQLSGNVLAKVRGVSLLFEKPMLLKGFILDVTFSSVI